MDWTDEIIQQLRELWDQGLPTKQIGLRLGISKNAVVGKARREGFTPRPSPIGKQTPGPRPPRAAPRKTLPPLASERSARSERVVRLPVVYREPPPPRQPLAVMLGTRCQYPLGEPGTREFRFCDQPVAALHPYSYCDTHRRVCYVERTAKLAAD